MRFTILFFLGVFLSIATAQAGNRDVILKSCKKEFAMTASQCKCVADAVEKAFDSKQLEFFMSVITKDRKRMSAVQAKMTPDDMVYVGKKMEAIPTKCGAS